MNDYERTVLQNVQLHGWHCTSVTPVAGDEDTPPFSYTVGLYRTYGSSELILFGLPTHTAHAIFGTYASRLREGRPIPLSCPSYDLIDDYPCVFAEVPRDAYNQFVYSALWFYAEVPFPLHQLVWPDREGRFPWHEQSDRGTHRHQPVLSPML